MIIPFSRYTTWDLVNKIVIVRADCNVPFLKNTIIDDSRLLALLPILNYLKKNKARVILITHRGKPNGYDPGLTNAPIADWFAAYYETRFIPYSPDYNDLFNVLNTKVFLTVLDNIRFYPDETSPQLLFAKQLAQHAHYYINDGWGVMHRNTLSITTLPLCFLPENRSMGALVVRELEHLNLFFTQRVSPRVLLVGGSKIKDKLSSLIELIPAIDVFLLCPPLSNVFEYELGRSIGASHYDKESAQQIQLFLDKARDLGKKVMIPEDYLVADHDAHGSLSYIDANSVNADKFIVSTGLRTTKLYQKELLSAQMILGFGLMGFIERPETLISLKLLLNSINRSSAYSIMGGGDSTALLKFLHCEDTISFISTGGGATLAYLARGTLPGLEHL